MEFPQIDYPQNGWPQAPPGNGWPQPPPGISPAGSPTLAQLSAQWSGGWTGRLCHLVERVDPREVKNESEVGMQEVAAEAKTKRMIEALIEKHQVPQSRDFETANRFQALG